MKGLQVIAFLMLTVLFASWCRSTLPADNPQLTNLVNYRSSDFNVVSAAACSMYLSTIEWEVADYYLFRVATARNWNDKDGQPVVLYATPLQPGKWSG